MNLKQVTVRRILDVIGPFLGLLLVIGLFSLNSDIRDSFLSMDNLKFVLVQTVIVGIGALGMTMIIVSGGIDLSVGSVIAFTGVLCAVLLKMEFAPATAFVAAVLAGGFIGFVNGAIITSLRMMPFIVTLGMLGMIRGFSKWMAGNQTVNPARTWITELMKPFPAQEWLIVAPGVWITVILAVLMSIVMSKTIFGRYIFAIGSNEATARLCGIRVPLMKILIYTCAGLFFGLAGLMQFARLRQGDPTAAVGIELDIIAAVVIGGASLSGGTGSILGSMIGALIMVVLKNGSQQMGWPTYVQEIIIGGVIILAVALDRLRHGMKSG